MKKSKLLVKSIQKVLVCATTCSEFNKQIKKIKTANKLLMQYLLDQTNKQISEI